MTNENYVECPDMPQPQEIEIKFSYRYKEGARYENLVFELLNGVNVLKMNLPDAQDREYLVACIWSAIWTYRPKTVTIQTIDGGKEHHLSRDTIQGIIEGRLKVPDIMLR